MWAYLILGPSKSLLVARHEPLYDENHIAFVLTVNDGPAWTPKLDPNKLKNPPPVEKLIPVKDKVDEDLLVHLKDACDWIKVGMNSGKGRVLVHCQQGRSRSGTVVVAYGEDPSDLHNADLDSEC